MSDTAKPYCRCDHFGDNPSCPVHGAPTPEASAPASPGEGADLREAVAKAVLVGTMEGLDSYGVADKILALVRPVRVEKEGEGA